MNSTSELAKLQNALGACAVELSEVRVEKLLCYYQVVLRLNERINLTRHTTLEKFAQRDVLDSVRLAEQLGDREEILDVGTGGGVPGLLVSILRPDVQVSVCDSVKKKAIAVDEIVRELDLHIPVYAERAEVVLDDFRFSSLTARAVGPMWKLLRSVQDHWHGIGRLLLIKGPRWVEERGEARHRGFLKNLALRKLVSYPMPGTDSESVVLSVGPKV